MTEPILIPSDDAIERGLASRAPRRPDAALFDTVMTGVHGTRQVSRRGATLRDPIGDRRRPIVLSALAAVLIVAGTLLMSTGSSVPPITPPAPTVLATSLPAAIASRSSEPEASPSASPLTCATQTTSVLTGSAMPRANAEPMTVPAGVLRMGVYLSAPSGAGPVNNDVWAVTSGTAKRIASIVGPDYNQASVDDISPDGRTALIGIGVVHGSNPGPECSDLYAVRTDGSGATRLTFNGPNAHADNGAFSQDGRFIAFVHREAGAVPLIGLVDLKGDPVAATTGAAQLIHGATTEAWSSDGRSKVYTEYVDGRTVLTVYDLTAKTAQRYGSIPPEFRGGVWRLP